MTPQRPLCRDRCDQRFHASDVHHPGQIVGEHRERHLGRDLRQGLRQEVRRTHPRLHCTERMLDRLAAQTHGSRARIETLLNGVQHVLVFPAWDAPLRPGRASRLQRALRTRRRPIAAYHLAVLLCGEPIGHMLSGLTAVDILFRHIDKVLLTEAALRFRARRHWLGHVTVMPASTHSRISGLLKYPRSATAASSSVCRTAFACLAMFASCERSEPLFVTSWATIR